MVTSNMCRDAMLGEDMNNEKPCEFGGCNIVGGGDEDALFGKSIYNNKNCCVS